MAFFRYAFEILLEHVKKRSLLICEAMKTLEIVSEVLEAGEWKTAYQVCEDCAARSGYLDTKFVAP
jgi:hypothetical protein